MLAGLGFSVSRPLLQRIDAETAHRLTIQALKLGPAPQPKPLPADLKVNRFGLSFPSPLGLAAGFDKNAEVPGAMLGLGFGFVEVGTVTPRPQSGNPRPRLFRLAEDQGVINRLGFNNEGHEAVHARLMRRPSGIIGVNLGANKDTEDKAADYEAGIAYFADVADYVTINVSSPNTPGLRSLQSASALGPLLARLNAARARQRKSVPMLLKIAPDLDDADLEAIARRCEGGAVDGVILTNTTVSRGDLRSTQARQEGGLSGKPLFALATRQLARFHLMTGGKIPLIGAGGIASAEDAWRKIIAGASLLQIYSALAFQGPKLIADITQGLAQRARAVPLSQAVGSGAYEAAYQKLGGR
jgi:dihydroorotate dehydrogenase